MRGIISRMSEPVALNPLLAAAGDFQYTTTRATTAAANITTVDVSMDLLAMTRNLSR
jgi:hypothetical protein